ncbi:MAG TPA: HDOD domain-containing protein [Spongiibacteraceae bacterium]|nr:HDOD domain-containing protein [Spongiibacteraceae bacterium]
MSTQQTMGIDAWVTRLSRAELPVLSEVMGEINRLTSGSDTSVSQLSAVILRDAALTAKVLRVANSAYFNPHGDQDVNTISRAVVKLGFQGIKAISLSVMLIDSLLKKGAKQRMLEWLARGFHAAVQAEQLPGGRDKAMKEDVFIATLLMHVGDMAFWSCRGEQMNELERILGDQRENGAYERSVIGTTLHEITQQLARVWELGDTINEALQNGECDTVAAQAVRLGNEISLAAEDGWDSEALESVLDKVAAFTGKGREEARQMLLKGAEDAAAVALNYGANKVCNFIPSTSDAPKPVVRQTRADPQLQLSILRELAGMINERVDANTLFQTVIEGIHRGVGFERVALLLVEPKKKILLAKYVLGEDVAQWREAMQFSIKGEQDNLLAYCVHSRQLVWMRRDNPGQLKHLLDPRTKSVLATDNCVMSALYAGARQIGVLYADRGHDGDPIEQDQYDSFCHFAQQTNMGLAMLAERRGR